MRPNDIALAISQLTDLKSLDRIAAAVKDRRQALGRLTVAALNPGDRVTFGNSIRPTYLKGLTAEVVTCNRESVTIKCPTDSRYGRFSGSQKVRLPISLIG